MYFIGYKSLIDQFLFRLKGRNFDNTFHKDELIKMFSEAKYLNKNTITFDQLLNFFINKINIDSIENMKNIQKIINNYNKNINSNDNEYSHNIENKLIFEILLLNDKLYNNLNNFIGLTQQLELDNTSSYIIEQMEDIINRFDCKAKLYNNREYCKAVLENNEQVLNNDMDNYSEIFSNVLDDYRDKNNISEFFKDVYKTYGTIDDLI